MSKSVIVWLLGSVGLYVWLNHNGLIADGERGPMGLGCAAVVGVAVLVLRPLWGG